MRFDIPVLSTPSLYSMQAVTVRLDHPIDAIELGARTSMLWSRNGMVLAGHGVAHRIAVDRPDGAAAAQHSLTALAGDNALGLPGTGPLAFGAFPFDQEASGELIVPSLVVGLNATGDHWLTTVGITPEEAHDQIVALLAERPARTQATTYELRSAVTPESWRDQVVAPVRDRIVSGEFNKVVLARELLLETDEPIDVAACLRRLHQSFGTAIIFAVDGFIGASPELLVSRDREMVRAHPLAGTAPRSSDPCLLYTSPSPRDRTRSRMPSSA